MAVAIRIESRDKTYSGSVSLDKKVASLLRRAGRLMSILSLSDEYDDDLSIFRRVPFCDGEAMRWKSG